jgi:hypothetical protein
MHAALVIGLIVVGLLLLIGIGWLLSVISDAWSH